MLFMETQEWVIEFKLACKYKALHHAKRSLLLLHVLQHKWHKMIIRNVALLVTWHCVYEHNQELASIFSACVHCICRKTSLYCSEVTQSLLLKDPSFTQLAPFLRGLPMEQPVSMTLDPSADAPPLNFTVTLLPAGHCPGSAMYGWVQYGMS